jgi:hypothetical protein
VIFTEKEKLQRPSQSTIYLLLVVDPVQPGLLAAAAQAVICLAALQYHLALR